MCVVIESDDRSRFKPNRPSTPVGKSRFLTLLGTLNRHEVTTSAGLAVPLQAKVSQGRDLGWVKECFEMSLRCDRAPVHEKGPDDAHLSNMSKLWRGESRFRMLQSGPFLRLQLACFRTAAQGNSRSESWRESCYPLDQNL